MMNRNLRIASSTIALATVAISAPAFAQCAEEPKKPVTTSDASTGLQPETQPLISING